jgi:hypothetical protein
MHSVLDGQHLVAYPPLQDLLPAGHELLGVRSAKPPGWQDASWAECVVEIKTINSRIGKRNGANTWEGIRKTAMSKKYNDMSCKPKKKN